MGISAPHLTLIQKKNGEEWPTPPLEGEFEDHEGDTKWELLLENPKKVRKGLKTHVPAYK